MNTWTMRERQHLLFPERRIPESVVLTGTLLSLKAGAKMKCRALIAFRAKVLRIVGAFGIGLGYYTYYRGPGTNLALCLELLG